MTDALAAVDLGQLFGWLGLLSAATFLISLLIIPWLVARARSNYFLVHTYRVEQRHQMQPLLFLFVGILRNTLGSLLLIGGFVMLFVPGQGLLTMVIGLSLLDVPGRQQLLDRLIQIHAIQQSLNWIRRKTGKKPFRFPETTEAEEAKGARK